MTERSKLLDFLSIIVCSSATVAQTYDTFWVGVTSQPVEIDKRNVRDPIPSNPFRPNRLTTTTPPNFNPESPKQASADFDPFYDGCGSTKLCFGAPTANCVSSKSCKAVVAITVTGDRYDFELKADSNAAWVGVGLSDDDKMGDDSVIECVKRGTGVAAYMSWTSRTPFSATRLANVSKLFRSFGRNLNNEKLKVSEERCWTFLAICVCFFQPQLGIELLNSSIVDDVIYCKVRRDIVTQVNDLTFDLVNNKYHLLVASGASVSGKCYV